MMFISNLLTHSPNHNPFPSNLLMRIKYMSYKTNATTGLMETETVSVKFSNVDKTKYSRKGDIFLYG
jgi:hypothetical protein